MKHDPRVLDLISKREHGLIITDVDHMTDIFKFLKLSMGIMPTSPVRLYNDTGKLDWNQCDIAFYDTHYGDTPRISSLEFLNFLKSVKTPIWEI